MSPLSLSGSFQYLCYGSTVIRNSFILPVRGASLCVRIWHSRQILTSKDGPHPHTCIPPPPLNVCHNTRHCNNYASMLVQRMRCWFSIKVLVTGPVHLCAIYTQLRAFSPAAVSAHWTHRTNCHLCPTRYFCSRESSEAIKGEVPCPRTQHRNNVPRLGREKHEISPKILHQAGFETTRQSAT